MKFEMLSLCYYYLLCLLIVSCDSVKYQYWDNGKVKVKEVRTNLKTTRYYYNENGKTVVDKIIYKDGTYIKQHYDDGGKVDTKEILDTSGILTEYNYDRDGKVHLERIRNDIGLILWKSYYNGILISEEQYFNGNKHGLCSKYYCQDGSLKYQCVFKSGVPYSGVWPFSPNLVGIGILDNLYYKYTEGKKEKFDFKPKEFPYILCYYYNVTTLKDNTYRLDLNVRTSTTTCERHGDGEFTLKSAKIIGYNSTCLKLIDILTFKVISRKNSWILLQGKTEDDSLYLDSITISNEPNDIFLSSNYKVIPRVGQENNFRTLSPND